MAWGWQGETRTVANVSTNVSISIRISNRDEWSAWQPGLVCPQLETGGPLSLASGYLDKSQCASLAPKHTHINTHCRGETLIHVFRASSVPDTWRKIKSLFSCLVKTWIYFTLLFEQSYKQFEWTEWVTGECILHVLQHFVMQKYVGGSFL